MNVIVEVLTRENFTANSANVKTGGAIEVFAGVIAFGLRGGKLGVAIDAETFADARRAGGGGVGGGRGGVGLVFLIVAGRNFWDFLKIKLEN